MSDIIVFTDGSGHKDGYGGWAAIATTPDGILRTFRMGAASGTSTDRMEFTAMLEGLQMALEMSEKFPRHGLIECKSSVKIISDRENLVLSIKKAYARSNAPDLWARFEYYEKILDIQAKHVGDEEKALLKDFTGVDLEASTGRILIRDYLKTVKPIAEPFLLYD